MSGTITDASGHARDQYCAEIFFASGEYPFNSAGAVGQSDRKGHWSTHIPAGKYRVHFTDCSSQIFEWYPDVRDYGPSNPCPRDTSCARYADAGNVLVLPGETTIVDAILETAPGWIEGRISARSPMNVCVVAAGADGRIVYTGNIWPDGTYRVWDLPDGDYKLGFTNCGTFVYEWYDDQPTFATATILHVATGRTLVGIDATIDDSPSATPSPSPN